MICYKCFKIINKNIILFIFIFIFTNLNIYAQQNPTLQSLTRGKLWYSSYGMGIIGPGVYGTVMAYPGYYDAGELVSNHVEGGAMWKVNGKEFFGGTVHYGVMDYIWSPKPNELHKNYNFMGEGGINAPEEWTVSINEYYPVVNPPVYNGKLSVKTKNMVWSVPKYDDFLIQEITLINVDTVTMTDLYYFYPRKLTWGSGKFSYDKEYIWDEELQTFIF